MNNLNGQWTVEPSLCSVSDSPGCSESWRVGKAECFSAPAVYRSRSQLQLPPHPLAESESPPVLVPPVRCPFDLAQSKPCDSCGSRPQSPRSPHPQIQSHLRRPVCPLHHPRTSFPRSNSPSFVVLMLAPCLQLPSPRCFTIGS